MEVKNFVMKKPKKSAADIEALRWREMFQAALTGLASEFYLGEPTIEEITQDAARIADMALVEFYSRYEGEK